MLALVGLGNPGSEYSKTRHNAGFLFIDALAKEFDISVTKKKFNAYFGCGKIDNIDVILIKPQTYMNLSGSSVQKLLSFFKLPEDHLIVSFDDLDLSFGTVKIRFGGGHSGHNGVRSLLESLPSDKFYRIKIGIGKPSHKNAISQWVLHEFSEEELNILHNDIFSIAHTKLFTLIHEIKIKSQKEKESAI